MIRLKYYLHNMQHGNETYSEMYAGRMVQVGTSKIVEHNSSIYWNGSVGYDIIKSNRIELSKPLVKIYIPIDDLRIKNCSIASANNALHQFVRYIDELNARIENRKRTDVENGKYYIIKPSNRVVLTNSSYFKTVGQRYYEYISGERIQVIDHDLDHKELMCLVLMIQVQLPEGKHKKAIEMLTKDLPNAVNRYILNFDHEDNDKAIELEILENKIREWLKTSDYCAFIANGSVLVQKRNENEIPQNVVPFYSIPENVIEVYSVKGMGIRKGVTVLTGGGYSGKSTLLDAISEGIYNHVLGSGCELVITDQTAIKISAEDGRSISNVNLSPFITWIPNSDVNNFSTIHASGSVSQAANVIEAIGYGSKLFIIDEDKSATNYMIRDLTMRNLIKNDPLIPFVERVRELYEKEKISIILVIGACSDYLGKADNVFMLKDYRISCITDYAKKICDERENGVSGLSTSEIANWRYRRELITSTISTYKNGNLTENLFVSDMGYIFIGDEVIDTRMIANIDNIAQMTAIAFIIRMLANRLNPCSWSKKEENEIRTIDLNIAIDDILDEIEEIGLECLNTAFFDKCGVWMSFPRKIEIYAVFNRMRNIEFDLKIKNK